MKSTLQVLLFFFLDKANSYDLEKIHVSYKEY